MPSSSYIPESVAMSNQRSPHFVVKKKSAHSYADCSTKTHISYWDFSIETLSK